MDSFYDIKLSKPDAPLLLQLHGNGLELLLKCPDPILSSGLGALKVVKVGL
jgi:hypothetical protein